MYTGDVEAGSDIAAHLFACYDAFFSPKLLKVHIVIDQP